MKKAKNSKLSIRALSRETGVDRATAAKLAAGITDHQEAVTLIRDWQSSRAPGQTDVDPTTGLSWFKAKLREDTIAKRRENEFAQKTISREWIEVAQHHRILGAYIQKIEQLPGKLRSEQGLTDSQANAMRRALDDARIEAGKDVLRTELGEK